MKTQTDILPYWGNAAKVPASQASSWLQNLLSVAGVNDTTLAHGVDMAEAQINRIKSTRVGFVKTYTLSPLTRAAVLIDEARKTLSKEGVHQWLTTPNPYLNDVPPILCLRSDKELEKAKSLLAAVRYGFPA
jgi:uncharacterized protein (DUF2384 family)